MSLAYDCDTEGALAYDRAESLGEWRALVGAPDSSQDEFWAGVLDAPVLPPENQEVDF